jgi:hypothetical protein
MRGALRFDELPVTRFAALQAESDGKRVRTILTEPPLPLLPACTL